MALIKEMKRDVLHGNWHIITFLFAQLVTVFLIAFQAMEVAGLRFDFYTRELAFVPNASAENLVVLVLALVVFALLYMAGKKRHPSLYKAEKLAPGIIKEEAKKKLHTLKSRPQEPALLFIEFFFVVVVIIALRAYLDPDIELIPWSAVGIGPPITTIVNAAIAIIVLAVFFHLYNLTRPYREWAKAEGKSQKGSGGKAGSGRKKSKTAKKKAR